MLFTINGERNSGTNFLSELLKANNFPLYHQVVDHSRKICYHWKHGDPDGNKSINGDKIVDIFIFRNLDEWLVSFWKNPYEVKPIQNFEDFLVKKQIPQTWRNLKDYRTNRCLNEDDNGKNIFEIRYYKFNKIIDYKNSNKDIIFVNLKFLQDDDNARIFLKTLNEKYMNRHDINYITTIKHTVTETLIKNQDYNLNISNYYDIIGKNKDNKIEKFITSLDFKFYP